MPTITLTPTACTVAAGWETLYYYATDNSAHYPRQMVFTFPTNATLGGAGVNITGITFHGYVRNSSSATKRLQMGFKTSTSQAQGSWAGYNGANAADSAFMAADGSPYGWEYHNFARAASASSLPALAGWMQQQFAAGNPLYLGVIQPQDGRSISVNATLSRWTITVDYELLGNVPSANISSATLGSTAITTTIQKVISGSTTTLRYKVGNATLSTASLGTGTSHAYTPPTSAGSQFPNAQTAVLTIEAETFVGSTSYGTVSTSVTLNLPSDAAPTATCSLTRTWVSGVSSAGQIAAWVQSRSGVTFNLTGTAKYGASISTFRVTIDGKTYTRTGNGSVSHSPISDSGTIAYAYEVTDSRGLSRSYSGSISVLAWSAPKITRFAIDRATSGNALAIDGTYARATVQGSASSLSVDGSQKNSLKYYVQYRQAGTSTWTNGDTVSLSAVSVNQNALIRKSGAAVGSFDDMTGYEFQLVLSDLYASSTALDAMPTKETFMAVDEATGKIGFGGEAPGSSEAAGYRFHRLVDFDGGIGVAGGYRYGWRTGDVIEIPSYLPLSGYVSSSTASARATLFLGQPIYTENITISGNVVIRGIDGYLNNMSYGTGIAVGTSGYTFTYSIVNARAGIIVLYVNKSSAFTNATNNTPIVMSGASNGPLILTFN